MVTDKRLRLTAFAVVLAFFIIVVTNFVTANTSLSLEAYKGPLYFWLQFPWLYVVLAFAGISVFFLLYRAECKRSFYFAAFSIAIGAYVTKILLPYYLFNGLVHYDVFYHYLDAQVLSAEGLDKAIHFTQYLYWPNTASITLVFQNITGTNFIQCTSFLTVGAEIGFALLLFLLAKKLFGPREAVLSLLLATLVEPISIHYSPFTIALTVMLFAFTLFFYGVFQQRTSFKTLAVLVAITSVLYHPFLSVILGLIILAGILSLKYCSNFSYCNQKMYQIKTDIYMALIVVVCTLIWWLYVSIFIFKTLVVSLESIAFGHLSPIETLPLTPSNANIASQVAIANLLGRFIRYILPAIVVLPVLVLIFYLFLHRRATVKHIRIFFLAIIIGFLFVVWYLIGVAIPFGFGERFNFIYEIFLSVLSAACLIEITNKKRLAKLYPVLALLFVVGVVISPLSSATDYAGMYYGGMTHSDLTMSSFTANHLVTGEQITGDYRFTFMVEQAAWPQVAYFNTIEFENNIPLKDFHYNSTIIILNKGTANYVIVERINDTDAALYISNMPQNLDLVYGNGFDNIFA